VRSLAAFLGSTMFRAPGWLLSLCFSSAILVAVLALFNSVGADRWWFGAFNLYLPQVLWFSLGTMLLILVLVRAPRLAWLPALSLLVVLGPVMGLCWRLSTPAVPQDRLRVMSWNAKYGKYRMSIPELIHELDLVDPDVALFQDSDQLIYGPVPKFLKGWQFRSFGQFVIGSRYPLSDAIHLPIPVLGDSHSLLRCELTVRGRSVVLYDVHLQTPRDGLNAFRDVRKKPWYLPEAIDRLEANVQARFRQARVVAGYVARETGTVLLAGDLNSPDSSYTCQMLREAGLQDAFAHAGRGYGYTYGHFLLHNRLPRLRLSSWMRLDHIMTTDELEAVRCCVGTWKASDHRPVIADLVWTGRRHTSPPFPPDSYPTP
jgi:endonuclease/exonuclease/phosphatase family metal-dependent hydrolase